MLNISLLIVAIIYIVTDIFWSRHTVKRLRNLEETVENLKAMFDRTDRLQMLAIEEQNQFIINQTSDLRRNIAKDLKSLTQDLDRTIASIDSIQEKIAELEVSTQNIQNNVNRLMS